MASSALPLELYRPIAEHLDSRDDVHRWMRANWFCYRELENIFYRKLDLNHPNLDTIERVLSGFETSPRRASYVLNLTLRSNTLYPSPKLTAISTLLLQLTNLRHLELECSSTDLGGLLDDCSFQLQRFEFNGDDDLYLPRFLASQPRIQHLSIRYYRSTTELPSTTLPHLRILDGPTNVAMALMPTRSVERLFWRSSGTAYLDKAGPFPAVKVLKLAHHSLHGMGLENSLPSLRFLECEGDWFDVCISPFLHSRCNPLRSGW